MYFNMKFTEDLVSSSNNKLRTGFSRSMWYVTNRTAKGAALCVRREKKKY